MKKFKKILKVFDVSKFKPVSGRLESQYTAVYWNLWGQFGVSPEMVEAARKKGGDVAVTDYAWTDEAKKQFYSHPPHAKFMKKLGLHTMSKGMWVLNSEPCDYDDHVRREAERAEEKKVARSGRTRKTIRPISSIHN